MMGISNDTRYKTIDKTHLAQFLGLVREIGYISPFIINSKRAKYGLLIERT
jgi:hypothetical protein